MSKWLILVRLLLGEIPDRTEFAQPGMSAALQPYFELTQAVKAGDMRAFKQVGRRVGRGGWGWGQGCEHCVGFEGGVGYARTG